MKIRLSVLVAARNEEARISACLTSLFRQDTRSSFEVICIDNGSTDATCAVASQFPVKLVHQDEKGKALALQAGIAEARGEFLCFTDADCVVDPNWLSSIEAAFAQKPMAVAVVGSYRFLESQWLYRLLNRLILPISIWTFYLLTGTHSLRGSNFAIRRSDYEKAGGLDASILNMEDVEFGMRVAKLGKISFVPQMEIAASNRRIRNRILNFSKEFVAGLLGLFFTKKSASRPDFEEIR